VRRGLESEVDNLNEKIESLTKDLAKIRSLQSSDPVEIIRGLETDKCDLSRNLSSMQEEVSRLKGLEKELEEGKNRSETELSEAKERLALWKASRNQDENGSTSADNILDSIQIIWKDLGFPAEERDAIREQIENCLDATCARKLEEAQQLRTKTQDELHSLQTELSTMKASMGMEAVAEDRTNEGTLLQRVQVLRRLRSSLEPTYASNKERAESILKQVADICATIGLNDSELPDDIKKLREGVAVAGNLRDEFLSSCEEHLSALRVRKSEMLVRNTELLNETHALVSDMNLAENQILPLVRHSRKRRAIPDPEWWSEGTAETVVRAVASPGGVARVARSFYNHLLLVNESLSSLATGRRVLSKTLGDLVQRAQRTLLETVDGEMDASEAYASFHETLFRLPPLSKEIILACIEEVSALLSGVEDMTQSEIEALTVVWEALDVSSSDRGRFWGEVEDALAEKESCAEGPFDDVIQICLVDGEEWVAGAVKDATKSYRQLETRLLKLERVHKEVETLRARQDAKSKIISLDSEVRILRAKLDDFELKKCNKQRLLSKKTGSSNLLKEERFRKQAQQQLSSKLKELAKLLTSWCDDEQSEFDTNLLSDEVRSLLANSEDMNSWVEKRTEFMHLRTVKTAKRDAAATDRDPAEQPPRKRQATTRVGRMIEGVKNTPGRPKRGGTPRSKLGQTISSARKRKAEHRDQPPPGRSVKVRNPFGGTPNAKKRKPMPVNTEPSQAQEPDKEKKRLTLPPFGHVLDQASTPRNRTDENGFE